MEATCRGATATEVAAVDDVCVICHDELGSDELGRPTVVLPACAHLFHRDCFERFLQAAHEGTMELKCPICRRSLAEEEHLVAAAPAPTAAAAPVAPIRTHAHDGERYGIDEEGTSTMTVPPGRAMPPPESAAAEFANLRLGSPARGNGESLPTSLTSGASAAAGDIGPVSHTTRPKRCQLYDEA